MRLLTLLTITFLIVFGHDSNAQRWKKHLPEIQGGIGATSFLGELGGGEGPGKDLFLDFDGKSSRYLITGGCRYKLAEFASARANLTYARLSGNDEFAGDVHRQSRNLSFRTALIELTAIGEVYFIREKLSSRYKVRGIKGALGSSLSAYLFGGVGGFFFNPRGKYPVDNKWYSLQPLGTEGQGQAGFPKKYSRINMCIPIGIGAKFNLTRTMAISLEYGFRYTFTDYLDDVSGNYYNNSLIESNFGSKAAYFADPSLGPFPELTQAGLARGSSDYNDVYLYLNMSFIRNVSFKRTNKTRRKHSR